jgi:hypothetical protein
MLVSQGSIKAADGDYSSPSRDEGALFTKKPLGGLSCASCDKNL